MCVRLSPPLVLSSSLLLHHRRHPYHKLCIPLTFPLSMKPIENGITTGSKKRIGVGRVAGGGRTPVGLKVWRGVGRSVMSPTCARE